MLGNSDTSLVDLYQYLVKFSLKYVENYEFPVMSDDLNFKISRRSISPKSPS